jgi:hypothetical protein
MLSFSNTLCFLVLQENIPLGLLVHQSFAQLHLQGVDLGMDPSL